MSDETVRAGVYGVGQMGSYHARVYEELSDVDLVGVCDADADRAASVAADHGTTVCDPDALFDRADAVSVAVPTSAHYGVASEALRRGVGVLVEKPFTETDEQAADLIAMAADTGATLQVGHVERFNPAVQTLADVVADLDIIAVDARRLGPPIDRGVETSVTFDLMLHDLDIALSILDADVQTTAATGTDNNRYVTAAVTFENDVVGTFTASRRTQQKVRKLSITATDCKVDVDYTDRSVRIHRKSMPEYVENDGSLRYRHEGLVERPIVEDGEPLKNELEAFTTAVRDGTEPPVTGADGRRAMALAKRIDADARPDRQRASHNATH